MLQVALVVVVGGADQRLPEPRQHEDRAAAARRRDRARHHRQRGPLEDDVRPAAGPDDGDLGLVVELLGPQPVGPHARRVDDVGRPHLELGPALGVAHARADRAAALLQQRERLDAVDGHRAEALGLREHGQHEPHVVGLAVVEEVAAARASGPPARAGAPRPPRRRSRGGAPGSSPRPRRGCGRGGGRAARSGRPPSRRTCSARARPGGRGARRRRRARSAAAA